MSLFDLRRLFGAKEPSRQEQSGGGRVPAANVPDPANADEYVRRCLAAEFTEEKESRTFRSDPAFSNVLTPLNSQRYAEAIAAASKLLPRFEDFDLIYKWLGNAYRATNQLPRSHEVLLTGLRSRRKALILTDLGETAWQSGDVAAAVYWWSQAMHCLVANPIDTNAYLLLSYVAGELKLADLQTSLLRAVDQARPGQVRMDAGSAARLVRLVWESPHRDAMTRALRGLAH